MTTAAEQAGAVIDARGAMLETLELQRKAFGAEGFPEYGTRIDRIDQQHAREFLRRPPEGICYYSRDAFQESAS